MSRLGVILKDLKDEQQLVRVSRQHLLFLDINFQRNDSIKCFANLLMVATAVYFYWTCLDYFHGESVDNSWMTDLQNTVNYDIDMSDVTFICAYIILRTMLRFAERVYMLVEFTTSEANIKAKMTMWKFRTLLSYIIGFKSRPHSFDHNRSNPGIDFENDKFNTRMVNFQLWFVKFFCKEETFLRFRRRNRNWKKMIKNNMTLHKDVICGILSCTIAIIVNFFEEHQHTQEYVSRQHCTEHGGFCSTDVEDENCWCTVNLIAHIPTFIAVAGVGAFGIASIMRAVIREIFAIWLQPKYVKTTWAMSSTGEKWGEELTFPQTADVMAAYYGYPKRQEWINEINNNPYDFTIEELEENFVSFWNVTAPIKHFLFKGTTSFVLKKEMANNQSNNTQPILIVKGEWRGGRSDPKSEIRKRISCLAIQTIYISRSQGIFRWEEKRFWQSELSKSQSEGALLSEKSELEMIRMDSLL